MNFWGLEPQIANWGLCIRDSQEIVDRLPSDKLKVPLQGSLVGQPDLNRFSNYLSLTVNDTAIYLE